MNIYFASLYKSIDIIDVPRSIEKETQNTLGLILFI